MAKKNILIKIILIFLTLLLIDKKDNIQLNKENYNNTIYQNEIYATINIDKIKLYRPIYKYKSKLNKVDINIELLKESNNPKLEYGNIILASHNGNNKNSYFKHLDKLEKGDIIKIKYKNITYKYKLDNIYEVEKNNKINIKRDMYQNTLTLITCKKNTINKQEVYISYLI